MADITPGMTRQAAVARLTAIFAQAGLDSPALDARLLACAALGVDHAGLILREQTPLASAADLLSDHADRRLAGEPVSRILGEREFWDLSFKVTPDVLDPRPDTETLVAAALHALPDRDPPLRILDLGVGSGALLAALLHERRRAFAVGVDRSAGACRVAAANLARLGLEGRAALVCGDWAAALSGTFDLVVSNPPYVESAAIAGLSAEVRRHDPLLALDGGMDGCDAYRAILRQLPRLLAHDGRAVLELGQGQAPAVAAAAAAQGMTIEALRQDLGGIDRALVLRRRRPSDPP